MAPVAWNFASDLKVEGRRFRFPIRDRDTKSSATFDTVFASMGIEIIRTPVRAPSQRIRRGDLCAPFVKNASSIVSSFQGDIANLYSTSTSPGDSP